MWWIANSRACFSLGAFFLLCVLNSGCSKEKGELTRHWDGSAKLVALRGLPKPRTAEETDLKKVRMYGGPANLTTPVDWKQNPYKSEAWVRRLHEWEWIWPWLVAFEEKKDKAALKTAIVIALDWIKQNPLGREGSKFAWDTKTVSGRAPALGYMLRHGTDSGLLSHEDYETMLMTARQHAGWLASDDHYVPRRSKSVALDVGLIGMCYQLNKLGDCAGWRVVAKERFLDTMKGLVGEQSGIVKDQSVRQQYAITDWARKMAMMVPTEPMKELAKKMVEASGWLTPPDHRTILLGQTMSSKAPSFAVEAQKGLKGIAPLESAGYGIVRQGGSFLFAVASFNSPERKHRDELSFSWLEGGERIIGDSGYYARSKSKYRGFTESARAHNVLTADDRDFSLRGRPYGSGIIGADSKDDWYALAGHNPLLSPLGIDHQRVWLYRPGKWLLVLDRVDSKSQHEYRRYFHFDHSLKLKLSDEGLTSTVVKKMPLVVFDISPNSKIEPSLIHNQKQPIQGVMFTRGKRPHPNYVLELKSTGEDALLGTAFRVGEAKLDKAGKLDKTERPQLSWVDGEYKVVIGDETVVVRVDDKQVAINPPPKSKEAKDDAKPAAVKPGSAPAAPTPAQKAPQGPAPAAPGASKQGK